jgi:hypothetical protein
MLATHSTASGSWLGASFFELSVLLNLLLHEGSEVNWLVISSFHVVLDLIGHALGAVHLFLL